MFSIVDWLVNRLSYFCLSVEKLNERRGKMFFQGWNTIAQTIILSLLMYLAIVIIIRASGKRTLSSFNAFDFLITVTIGSISASTILSSDTKFFDGISAVITLVILQYIVAKLSVYFKPFRKLVKSDPTLLYYEGEYILANLQKMRVSVDDILQEVRIKGKTIDEVHSVILESNGQLAVITTGSDENLDKMIQYK